MRPVVKKSELDSFEKWKDDEAKKYVKKYKKNSNTFSVTEHF